MKITKYIIGLGIMAGTVISLPSCTDLSETVYDQVMSQNYYNTKQDVINAVFVRLSISKMCIRDSCRPIFVVSVLNFLISHLTGYYLYIL